MSNCGSGSGSRILFRVFGLCARLERDGGGF